MAENGAARRVVEIRSYLLKPGTAAEFDRLVAEVTAPMLRRWQVDVVAFGPSLRDRHAYYLACIDSYISIVIEMDGAAVEGLRE